MKHRTTESLAELMNSILATESETPATEPEPPTKDRLLAQLEGLGNLERLAKVALRECVVELRREKATWERIAETFGSSYQSAYGRWRDAEARDKADELFGARDQPPVRGELSESCDE